VTVASQVKQTLASLKNANATLQIYLSQSQNDEAKKVFDEACQITDAMVNEMEDRLKTIEFEEPQYKGV
jgi:uncharacterized protein YaaQ